MPSSPQLDAVLAGQGRRGEIMAAAIQVFGEQGYEGGSMREIADVVGVSEPALYRYFASKESMFIELIETVGSRLRDEVFSILDAAHAPGLRAQMISAFAERRARFRAFAPLLRAVLTAANANQSVLDAYRRTVVLPIRDHLGVTAARLDEEFETPDAEKDRAARVRALMALLVGTFVSSLVLGDTPDEATADAVMRVMRWE